VKSISEIAIKFSQGNVVTQTVLGGPNIHLPVANFLWRTLCQKLWKLVKSTQSYCNKKWWFFGPPCRERITNVGFVVLSTISEAKFPQKLQT